MKNNLTTKNIHKWDWFLVFELENNNIKTSIYHEFIVLGKGNNNDEVYGIMLPDFKHLNIINIQQSFIDTIMDDLEYIISWTNVWRIKVSQLKSHTILGITNLKQFQTTVENQKILIDLLNLKSLSLNKDGLMDFSNFDEVELFDFKYAFNPKFIYQKKQYLAPDLNINPIAEKLADPDIGIYENSDTAIYSQEHILDLLINLHEENPDKFVENYKLMKLLKLIESNKPIDEPKFYELFQKNYDLRKQKEKLYIKYANQTMPILESFYRIIKLL